MNPGVTEETGKTVRSLFETLKDHPAMLVLSLANLALIAFIYFALNAAATFRTELIKQSFEFQNKTADLLARCVVQGPRTNLPTVPSSPAIEVVPLPPSKPNITGEAPHQE